jgi:hypothetical protein
MTVCLPTEWSKRFRADSFEIVLAEMCEQPTVIKESGRPSHLEKLSVAYPALAALSRFRRSSASRLQSPPPRAAMYRKRKQNRTAAMPWF